MPLLRGPPVRQLLDIDEERATHLLVDHADEILPTAVVPAIQVPTSILHAPVGVFVGPQSLRSFAEIQ